VDENKKESNAEDAEGAEFAAEERREERRSAEWHCRSADLEVGHYT